MTSKCQCANGYVCVLHCPCCRNYWCMQHRPDYNSGLLGIEYDFIYEKEGISRDEVSTLLANKSISTRSEADKTDIDKTDMYDAAHMEPHLGA